MKAREIASATLALAATAALLTSGFSRETWYILRVRANGRSEVSGRFDWPLQASHINHNKKDERYDSPEMGISMTLVEHYVYHLAFELYPECIGLDFHGNKSAIASLRSQIRKFCKKAGRNQPTVEELEMSMQLVREKVAAHCDEYGIQNPFMELHRLAYVEA